MSPRGPPGLPETDPRARLSRPGPAGYPTRDMSVLFQVLRLGRGHGRRFAVVALLVSLGTAASLFEPWIYRAIVDDVAGVLVTPTAVRRAETTLTQLGTQTEHLVKSGQRIFRHPLRKHPPEVTGARTLRPRTVNQAVATVILGAVLLVLTRLLSEACRTAGDNRAVSTSSGIERGFILRTFRHVLRLPLGFFSQRSSGTVSRQIDQSDQVAPIFTAFSHEIWPEFFSLVAILAIMASLNRGLAMVAFLAVPVYALVSWRMSRRLESRMEEYYALWDGVSGRIQEAMSGIKTVLSHGTAEHEFRRLDAATAQAFRSYLERNRMQNRYSLLQEVVVTAAKATTLLLGGMKALEHQLTPGDVVLFVAYLDQLYNPIQSLTDIYVSLQEKLGSVNRAQRLLAAPEAPGEDLPAFRPGGGEIEFRDVRFGYRAGRMVLDGVSFRVSAGQRVALVGPSGSGKTTLTDLLVGLYRPLSGEILVDGQPVTAVSPSTLRASVRGVAPDGALFHASVAENIRYGRLEARRDEIEAAARLAGLEPVVARLPHGMDTEIGERGFELSAGERQRVLLARAFVARPTVLVLDEATANLDFRTEASVKEALARISEGRTTLLIAHRRSMLTDVDRVLVLRGGRIAQDGTPAELAAVPGYYADMMQAAHEPYPAAPGPAEPQEVP